MRLKRYSPRTEAAYIDWIKRFIRFHGVRHPQEMGADEVKAFLGHLATEMNVVASTQNQYLTVLKKQKTEAIPCYLHVVSRFYL